MSWPEAAARRRYHVGNVHGRLLREARSILVSEGLPHLNLRALAARVGIAPGSVYHHYENKAALLAELASDGFRELEGALQDAMDAPPGARIRTLARAYFEFARTQAPLFALMFDPAVMNQPGVGLARESAFKVLEQAVAFALPSRDPEALNKIALAVWACGHGAATLRSADPALQEGLIEDVIQGLELLFGRR